MANVSRTILLVEDSEDDAFTFRRALKKAHIDNPLLWATDGQRAIDMLSESANRDEGSEQSIPCLVFLDLKLPHHDGFQVLEWLRAQPHLKETLVVMLTGSEEPRDQQRSYALGARSYLVKPISADDLRSVVESLRTFWAGVGVDPIAAAP